MIEDLDEADKYVAGDETGEIEGEEATPWNIMKQDLLEKNKKPKFDKTKHKEFQKLREDNYKKFIKEETLKKKKDAKWESFSDGEENVEKAKTVKRNAPDSTVSLKSSPDKKAKIEEKELTDKDKKRLEKKQKLKEKHKANRKLKLEATLKAKEELASSGNDEVKPATEVLNTASELKRLSKKKKLKERQKANRKIKREEHLKAINLAKEAKTKQTTKPDHGKASDDVSDIKIVKSPIKEVAAVKVKPAKQAKKKEKTIIEPETKDSVPAPTITTDATASEIENKNRKLIKKQQQKLKKNKKNNKNKAGTDVEKAVVENDKKKINGNVVVDGVVEENLKENTKVVAETVEQHQDNAPKKTEKPKEKGKFEKKNKNKKKLNDKKMKKNAEVTKLVNGDKPGVVNANGMKNTKTFQGFNAETKTTGNEKCFACREIGHVMRDCSKAGDTSICLKCGAADHTHTGCTVYSGPVYNFATCFSCKKKGHITSQCSEKKNGVYPDGGNCRYCASPEHLGKDCTNKKKGGPHIKNKFNKNKKQSFGKKPAFNKNKK